MPTGSVPCRNCGRPVPADSPICPSCGTPVNASVAASDPGQPSDPAANMAANVETDVAANVEAEAADGMASGGIVPNPAIPGSYLSPSTVFQPPAPEPPQPSAMPLAGTAAPTSDGWPEAPGVGASTRPEQRAGHPANGSPAAAAATGPRPGSAPLLADLPFDAPTSAAGWLVMIGSSVGSLSFLLPWAPHIVSYTSSWGLANLANIPILGLLIAITVLAILPNRVAPWVRSGVMGMIGGSLFLGLLWPYVVGDFGAEFGSVIAAAAAIALVVGGVLSIAPESPRSPPG